MGWTLEEAARAGIGHEHPDHPSRRQASAPKRKRSKYGAVPTTYGGVRYDSKAEALRAERLDHDRTAGLIRFWVRQPTFRLGCPENVYRADFLVVGLADVWAEDVKGKETPKFVHDKKLWARYGPCELRVLRNGRVVESVGPGRDNGC